jgi:hypothetical protein
VLFRSAPEEAEGTDEVTEVTPEVV